MDTKMKSFVSGLKIVLVVGGCQLFIILPSIDESGLLAPTGEEVLPSELIQQFDSIGDENFHESH